MEQTLVIYNTLTRSKERFQPLHAPNVGMYVCGPTVYGDPHLGHARPAITFDILFRYLKHLGYKVRYVRNITDVGHLEHDADEGDDKIAKKARLEQLEPMEIPVDSETTLSIISSKLEESFSTCSIIVLFTFIRLAPCLVHKQIFSCYIQNTVFSFYHEVLYILHRHNLLFSHRI